MGNKWDSYYFTHYKPANNAWGIEDLEKYTKWYRSWIKYISRFIKFQRGEKAFEAGSGIGATTRLLKNIGLDIIGSDVSKKIISAARRVSPDIQYVYCKLEDGIPNNRKCKYVFAFEVLEHIPDIDKALSAIYRGLSKDGIFIGSTPYPYWKNMLDPTHCNVLHPDLWKKKFVRSGFKHVVIKPMSFFPYLWRIHPNFNPVLPFYTSFPWCISTSLIIAYKH